MPASSDSAAYNMVWSPSTKRDLARLPEKVATAIVEFAYGSLSSNPRRVGHALHLDPAGLHSARRGAFRVIYRVDDENHQVHLVTVDHRSDVYRRR